MNLLRNILSTLILTIIFTGVATAQSSELNNGGFSTGVTVSITSHIEAYDVSAVEISPAFPGGEQALVSFINSERRYPREAYSAGVEGRVVCGFIVNPDGALSHVAVVRGVSDDLNREAVRVISSMPRWQPGIRGGVKVPVYYCLTIPFRL
ncbi:MAG: energy transducer TonB [Duncaniella sp.]|nr:energy transducer TonB [Duncaniella sp.]